MSGPRFDRLFPAAVALGLAGWTAWMFARYLPPFLDLPQHAWTIAMLRHPEAYADAFVPQLRPWSTNSFWFVVDGALAPFTSPEGSLGIGCALAVVLLPLGLAAWAGALGRSPGLALLAGWVATWTRSLHWGFVNYALSMATAVGVLALDAALTRWGPGPRHWRRWALAAGLALCYLQHAQTWAFVLVGLLLQRLTLGGVRGVLGRLGGAVLLALPSALLFLPFALANLLRPRTGSAPLVSLGEDMKARYANVDDDLKFLWENSVATVRWSTVDDALTRLLVAAAFVGLVRAVVRRDDAGRAGLPGMLLLATVALLTYLYAPLHVVGQFQISSRMAPWAVLLLVPAAAPVLAPWAHRVLLVAYAAAAVWTASLQAETLARFEAESRPVFRLMAKMAPGKTAALWASHRSGRAALGAVYTHVLGWYAERTLGRAQFSFAEFRPNPVVYRDPEGYPRAVAGEEMKAWCAAYAGDAVGLDYVLTRGDTEADATCGAVTRYAAALHEIGRERDWALYEVVGPLPAGSSKGCKCKARTPRVGPPRLPAREGEAG